MLLITGATGFLGSALLDHFKKDWDVIGISKTSEKPGLHKTDLSKREELEGIREGRIDTVVHAAAHTDVSTTATAAKGNLDVNVDGLVNLLEFGLSRGMRQIIYSSSVSIYGNLRRGLVTESSLRIPATYYAKSKYLGETILKDFCTHHGITYSILRYSSLYGYGQKGRTVIPVFIDQALRRGRIEVFGTGTRTQDFLYVDDAVMGNELALRAKKNIECNIASGTPTTMNELAEAVNKVFCDHSCEVVHDPSQPEDDNCFRFDIERAFRELGYAPRHSLESGLREIRKRMAPSSQPSPGERREKEGVRRR